MTGERTGSRSVQRKEKIEVGEELHSGRQKKRRLEKQD